MSVRTNWRDIAIALGAGIVASAHIGVVPTAIPALRSELGIDLVTAGWVASLFSATTVATGVLVGVLADRIGYRRLLVVGLIALVLGAVAGALASTAYELLLSRLVEGIGFIAILVSSPSIIAERALPEDRRFALGLWGTEAQQQTYLPVFAGEDVPAAALALNEPTVLFDVLEPGTTAVETAEGYTLNGVKSAVVRGAEAELFIVGANLDGKPVLFLVESSSAGLEIEGDPAMGLRAASLAKLTLTDVKVPADAVLGATDGSTYTECVRLSRLRSEEHTSELQSH